MFLYPPMNSAMPEDGTALGVRIAPARRKRPTAGWARARLKSLRGNASEGAPSRAMPRGLVRKHAFPSTAFRETRRDTSLTRSTARNLADSARAEGRGAAQCKRRFRSRIRVPLAAASRHPRSASGESANQRRGPRVPQLRAMLHGFCDASRAITTRRGPTARNRCSPPQSACPLQRTVDRPHARSRNHRPCGRRKSSVAQHKGNTLCGVPHRHRALASSSHFSSKCVVPSGT